MTGDGSRPSVMMQGVVTLAVWTLSCLAMYAILTRVLSVESSFSAALVGATAVLSLPAVILGLRVGISRARALGPPDAGAKKRLSRELPIITGGFALSSLLALAGILAMHKGEPMIGSASVCGAALVSWRSMRRLLLLIRRSD